MFRYTCLNPISSLGLDRLDAKYIRTENVNEAAAILVRSAKMHDMEFSPNLVAIARAGAGVNNIPLDRCAQQGIVVFNTPGANANGVKELVLAGMFLAARDIVGGVNWVQENASAPDIDKLAEKQKKQFAGTEISGKKLGIIGLGAIGQLVANAAVHLGMDVYGYDPYISVDAAWNLSRSVRHLRDVEEIYRSCDYITIHVPAMDSTKGMISREAIAMMKPNAVILNYARDVLVDEEAVIDALKEGRIHRYVTDFVTPAICGTPGVIITPHLGASTEEAEDNCAVMAANELKNFLENGNIKNSVNYPNCDLGECTSVSRIAICHRNVQNMISRFTAVLGDRNINIVNLTNKSRGEYAYSLLDIEEKPDQAVIEALRAVDGVFKVRIVK